MKDLNQLAEDYYKNLGKTRTTQNNKDGFLKCPCCGAYPHIRVEDDEGNCHDYDPDYEKAPWSGLWYVIEHSRDERNNRKDKSGDIPWNKECLIATAGPAWYGSGDVPAIGCKAFKTRKAAVNWWNKMVRRIYENVTQ